MPPKSSRDRMLERALPPFKGFVQYALNADEIAQIKQIEVDAVWLAETLDAFLDADIAVKFSYDAKNECYTAVLSRMDNKHKDAGVFLSGRGSTLIKALRQAAFIHYNCVKEVWREHLNTSFKTLLDD